MSDYVIALYEQPYCVVVKYVLIAHSTGSEIVEENMAVKQPKFLHLLYF